MKDKIEIVPATVEDFPAIKEIYLAGIATGNATFTTDESVPNGEKWFLGKVPNSVYLVVDGESVLGWCALSPYKDTCAYSGVAEVSVYVSPEAQGRGVGSLLMHHLVIHAEANNIWTLQAGIFPENEASLRLHYKYGFRKVGVREKIGKLNGAWRDVVLLEKRSERIF
jgi:L-amino acid N-acyltransferase YncA